MVDPNQLLYLALHAPDGDDDPVPLFIGALEQSARSRDQFPAALDGIPGIGEHLFKSAHNGEA